MAISFHFLIYPSNVYCIEENFQGRKFLQIPRFCGYTRKFSLRKLGRGILWHSKGEQSTKVFSMKTVFLPIRKNFLPQKFPAIQYVFLAHTLNLLAYLNVSKFIVESFSNFSSSIHCGDVHVLEQNHRR